MKKVRDLFHLAQIFSGKAGAARQQQRASRYYKSSTAESVARLGGKADAYQECLHTLLNYMRYSDKLTELGLSDELFELIRWIKDGKIDLKELRKAYEERRKK